MRVGLSCAAFYGRGETEDAAALVRGFPAACCEVFVQTPSEYCGAFGRVVREAEKLGVKIALENTEGEEYLAALMDAFSGCSAVGFCWDTGHELCYNYGKDMMALYGDRLLGTHLNDNLGIRDHGGRIFWHDDLHLLPFDGIADWQDIAFRLKRSGFTGPLTFELTTCSKPDRHENDPYGRMSPVEYLTSAYMRACRVAALLQKQN